ncbi:MAG: hypothetical protein ACK4RG_06905 [Fimbriimonadales bacterium]
MTRIIGWITAVAAWGCMFYALSLTQQLVERQAFHIAKIAKASGEYEIAQAPDKASLLIARRTKGQFFRNGNIESIEWTVDGRLSTLQWRVLSGRGLPIANNQPVFILPRELRVSLEKGMRLRMVKMTFPTGYYLVVYDKRGEIVGVLEIIWHT